MAPSRNAPLPTAVYGAVLLASALAYTILVRMLLAAEGPDSKLAKAIGSDLKGNVSLALYCSAIPLAFVQQVLADAVYVTVALIWLVPDRRIERRL